MTLVAYPMRETWYDRHVLPYFIDCACGLTPVRRQREKVVPHARGRVLEVGIGTGLNMAHYDRTRVTSITGVDPALQMHRLARRRIARAGLAVDLVGVSAERLPLPDASFDCVVCTYTLCSIPEPVTALRELRRVLSPEGRLLFCEHGLAPDDDVRRWQRRLGPFWKTIGGGCHLDRDIPQLLREGGFAAPRFETMYLPGLRALRFASFNYWGEARPSN